MTRCDQGVLAAARTAPNDRWTLVHRLSEALTVGEEQVFLSTQTFADDAPPPAVRSGGPSVRGETGRTLEIVFSLEGGTAWSPASFPRAGRSPATTPRTRPFCCSTACGYTTAGPGTPVSSAGPGRSWSALSPPTAGGPATPSAWSRTAHLRGGGAGPGDMDGRLRGGPSAPVRCTRTIRRNSVVRYWREGLDLVTWMDVCAVGHLPPPPATASPWRSTPTGTTPCG